MKYLVVGVLVVGIGLASYMGCGDGAKARLGVASDKAIAQIDKLLGELNVKQKKIENAYADLKKSTTGLREKRIEASVRLKQLTEKNAAMDKRKGKLVKNLKKLKGLLAEAKSTGKVELPSGKEVTIEQLKSLADGAVKDMKLVKDEITRNKAITNAWAKNLDLYKKNEMVSSDQLKKLQTKMEEIRSKKSALDGMKTAASISEPAKSISDKFKDVNEGVDELLVDVDTKLQTEIEKIDERMAEMLGGDAIDINEVLNDKADVSGTESEIDALLNEEGGE